MQAFLYPMPHPQANAILSQLPSDELEFLTPHMKLVSLKKGDILFEPGGSIEHYYFPLTCTLELTVDLPEGDSAATTVINMNGMYPLHLIGQAQSHNRAMVRSPGLCYRVPAWLIEEELQRSQSFLWLLLREAVSLFERASVESACLGDCPCHGRQWRCDVRDGQPRVQRHYLCG